MRLVLFQPDIQQNLRKPARLERRERPTAAAICSVNASGGRLATDSVAAGGHACHIKQGKPPMILAILICAAVFVLIAGQHALETWNQR